MSRSTQLVNEHYQKDLPRRHQQNRLNCLKNRLIRGQRLHDEYVIVMAQYVQ